MTIGISGDTASPPPTATTDDIPGAAIPVGVPMIRAPDTQFVFQSGDGTGRVKAVGEDMLQLIFAQLVTITMLLAEGLGTTTDPDQLRNDVLNDITMQ